MRILVTRPEPDASRTAARLRARGHRVVIDPVLAIEMLPPIEIAASGFAAAAVTSANAARALGAGPRTDSLLRLPLYAVGGNSAEAARAAGFTDVHDADGDAVALADLIRREIRPGARVLHLAGEVRSRDLGELLAPAGISVEVAVLYRMQPAAALGPGAEALRAGEIDAVLHFSSRSAASFVALVERQGLVAAAAKARHYCLSPAVAASLAGIGGQVETAAHPSEDSLLKMLDF